MHPSPLPFSLGHCTLQFIPSLPAIPSFCLADMREGAVMMHKASTTTAFFKRARL